MKISNRKRWVGFILLVGIFMSWAAAPLPALADDANQAQVIVQSGPGNQVVKEIAFSGTVSGIKALELSGLDIVFADYGWGTAVCSIEGVGCPAEDCFCDSNHYWSYYRKDSSGWSMSMAGASSTTVSDGGVEGWRWVTFSDPVQALPESTSVTAAQKALTWLNGQQSAENGGYVSMGSTVDSLLALGANGNTAADWKQTVNAPSILTFAMQKGAAYANSGADASGKMAAGLAVAQGCWPNQGKSPKAYFNAETGLYADSNYGQALAMLGDASFGESVPAAALTALAGEVQSDGGWEYSSGWGTDTNTTALVVQALIYGGKTSSDAVVADALTYLQQSQQLDGGFPYNLDTTYGPVASDANSTAFVVQAILAAGQDPEGLAWTKNGKTPIDFLLSLQQEDGSLAWQAGLGANLLATQQAIPALLYRVLPMETSLTTCPSISLPLVIK